MYSFNAKSTKNNIQFTSIILGSKYDTICAAMGVTRDSQEDLFCYVLFCHPGETALECDVQGVSVHIRETRLDKWQTVV